MTQGQRHWRYWSLRAKLVFMAIAAASIGISLSGIVLSNHQNTHYKTELAAKATVLAGILADQSAAAVLFDDTNHLQRIIENLSDSPSIDLACVYRAHPERLSATYPPNKTALCPDAPQDLKEGFQQNFHQVVKAIQHQTDTVGYLYLRTSTAQVAQQKAYFIKVIFFCGLLSALVLIALILKFQRTISDPLDDLTRIAHAVGLTGDLGLRASPQSSDEIGQLAAAFNDMLGRIEARHQATRKRNDRLESSLDARTRELNLATKEVEAFSYSVSHDLKQPLRAIEGFSDLLLQDYGGRMDRNGLTYLRKIRFSCARMGQLIDGMMKLARVTRRTLEPTEIDLNDMIMELINELEASDYHIPTELNIQRNMICYGDPTLLRIAFGNLLENAWKHTAGQAVRRIEISSSRSPQDMTISISDNGEGFDMRYVHRLFVAFHSMPGSPQQDGTQVGLAVVARIVNRHHGAVSAESHPGQGATFRISLPYPREAEGEGS